MAEPIDMHSFRVRRKTVEDIHPDDRLEVLTMNLQDIIEDIESGETTGYLIIEFSAAGGFRPTLMSAVDADMSAIIGTLELAKMDLAHEILFE